MMLTTSKSKQSTIYYVTKSLYNGGKRTSKVIERLGSLPELERRFGQTDTVQKATEYVKELTKMKKEGNFSSKVNSAALSTVEFT